ncbi:hypothetical protein JBL43_06710 [Aureibaculum sp. A20]|uniref:CHRD domain-containing protein n=1 Tax=Aureibaculum flavum TaxID=2795986 RepID=A0ABS0WPN1_9FLAO|nr:hypothetical protein [Aureibaculum flavum]MBJ2173922.1 hypothetical protein [Aureibaculum flavum]
MKNLIKKCLLATIILFTISCNRNSGDIDEINNNLSIESIREAPDGPNGEFILIDGATSSLIRTENGITANFKTKQLIPGNAYTLWWIVFGETPGPPASLFAVGHVVGQGGNRDFSAHLNTSPNFKNPLTAEVHMVLRTHGAAVREIVDEQIGGYYGGCDESMTSPGGPGLIWPDSNQIGYCADMQVAKHPAVK